MPSSSFNGNSHHRSAQKHCLLFHFLTNFSEKEERKNQIMTALLKLGTAQADVLLNEWLSPAVSSEDLDKTMLELAKWTDLTDSKVGKVALFNTIGSGEICF